MSAFGGKADMMRGSGLLSRSLLGAKRTCPFALHMSAFDPKRTWRLHREMSAYGPRIGGCSGAQFSSVELRSLSCVAFPIGDAHAGASYIGRPIFGYLPGERKFSRRRSGQQSSV